ncbi:type IV toxin-antitoxin system AbiEi family antitoxin domain-containing protein (plasmid) [Streptomyces sp. NBC_00841]|uniref:type IV toxin-antitoxin system AbiEi family antitoxin domain-containing protein n=1 Tax=Streptomyces sp. NBC_00841 TaxID=2975847 RepID=UPI002DDA1909|nr:type IV toxin-antitoxin system AbiEi family antitoxin domain-containing protein [Streptomyces sp. NBC_00841]WSA06000.1 type IV toxin-antitoxin system AbiEi family antitoxin domain-containing protein [Streptomyces sp. NBC_00841]
MDRGEQLGRIAEYAADQWGLVTAAQAKRIGLNAVQLLRLTEAGLLENVGRGVYLLQAAGFPPHLEIKVAWLRLQPAVFASERSLGDKDSGVVSHASACQLHGLGDIPAPKAEISVPRRRTTTEPFVRLRTAQLEPADITLVQGLPVTTARRTILDLLHSKADGGHIGQVIADAERLDLVAIEDLQEAVRPFTRAYGLPTRATGGELIEHLVSQAGERLRSQEVARASEEGFTTAIELMAQSAVGPEAIRQAMRRIHEQLMAPNPALEQLMRRIHEQTVAPNAALEKFMAPNPALEQLMRRIHEQTVAPNAALEKFMAPNPALEQLMRRIHEQTVAPNAALEKFMAPNTALEQALRRIREQITAPQPSSWHAIERMKDPNTSAARARQAIEQARASNDRAARESTPDQPAQDASEDVQKDMSGKQDST